jgi:hypothetical protein
VTDGVFIGPLRHVVGEARDGECRCARRKHQACVHCGMREDTRFHRRSIDAARGTSNGTEAAQAGDVLRFFRENGGQPEDLSGLVKANGLKRRTHHEGAEIIGRVHCWVTRSRCPRMLVGALDHLVGTAI